MPLLEGGNEPDHLDGDVHGQAASLHVDVDDDEIAAHIAEGATETFPAAYLGINREEDLAAEQAEDAVFEAFAMKIVHFVRHGLVAAGILGIVVAAGLHVVVIIALIPMWVLAVHRPSILLYFFVERW
jgi:hypothetical protein